ncbi:hypothetical protein CDD81_6337 [Ophiocordyceps australis]|uniref:NAD-dependent epimerase/dehydratase domain-containing protein n=1 Tax=Ophiocordyceps australis TaxID=1399860 RepID=A0A2C5Y764_9HYPO|nr:hypothetical protein CDD81_6337 [Ophiocordyceps australis]
MTAIPQGSLVLVTGVNGYIASHVALELLERGFRVRGTVRHDYKAEYMHAVFDEKYGAAFETLVVAEMSLPGAFDEAVQGCAAVMHVASDLTLNPDPWQVIPLVVSGVANALSAAARCPSIKRFVYTSSSAAITAPIANKKFHINSTMWNQADIDLAWAPPPYTEHRKLAVYAASKTLAEQACWDFVRQQNPPFVLNAVLPNCNIGKILSTKQPASTGGWYNKMWHGDADILHLLWHFPPQHYVNVTDTALLHVAALLEEDVVGERLLAFAGPFNWNDTVDLLEKIAGNGEKRWVRMDEDPRDLKTVDTARSEELLRRYGRPGFTSLEASLKECVDSY